MRSRIRDLLVQHHGDGRWYPGGLLDQYRTAGGWRCVVVYSTAPGSQYVLADPAELCRPLPEQHYDQADDGQAGHEQPHRHDQASPWPLAPRGHGGQG